LQPSAYPPELILHKTTFYLQLTPMPLGVKIFCAFMALGSLFWLRYAWTGFGGQVKDLEAHRKSGLMRVHFLFIGLVVIICTLMAILA